MALCTQMVNFIGLQLIEQLHQHHSVCQITVMEKELCPVHMRIIVQMIDPAGIKSRTATDNSMHLVTLFEKEFG